MVFTDGQVFYSKNVITDDTTAVAVFPELGGSSGIDDFQDLTFSVSADGLVWLPVTRFCDIITFTGGLTSEVYLKIVKGADGNTNYLNGYGLFYDLNANLFPLSATQHWPVQEQILWGSITNVGAGPGSYTSQYFDVTETPIANKAGFSPSQMLFLYINGVMQSPFGASPDFVLSGKRVTFDPAHAGFEIDNGDVVTAMYYYSYAL
jgi:hypothetical protein